MAAIAIAADFAATGGARYQSRPDSPETKFGLLAFSESYFFAISKDISRVRNRTDEKPKLNYVFWMTTRKWPHQDIDLDAQAQTALDEARVMPPGSERTEALRQAGILRNAADLNGFIFAKLGRPRKS